MKEEAHSGWVFSLGCSEMNGEGGLVLLSRPALDKERLGVIFRS